VKKIFAISLLFLIAGSISAQNFDFEKISKKAKAYTVAVDIKSEISFGTQNTESQDRLIGTIVSSDGLVMFDGTPIDNENPFSLMSGIQVSIVPKNIEITTMDGAKYTAEFIDVDRFTKLGFCRIKTENKKTFEYLVFREGKKFRIGEWLGGFILMPEYINPPLAADVGMVSSFINIPEEFILTIGFSNMQIGTVLYDESGVATGVLGMMDNPSSQSIDLERMYQSMSRGDESIPLLGIIGVDKLNNLIKDPPKRGKVNRGWLGIYLQALTADIADYWKIKSSGGIIINEVAKDSPADSAGLRTGDIICGLNGAPIDINKEENIPLFQKQISEMGAGTAINMGILRRRDGSTDTLAVKVVLAPTPMTPSEAATYKDSNFEMTTRDMVFADYNLYKLDRSQFKGVVVKEVESGGLASVADLAPGDIIQSIGGENIASVIDAEASLKKIAENKPKEVIFFIWRDNRTLFLNIKTDW
jgi:S1-C subfamily serine protease